MSFYRLYQDASLMFRNGGGGAAARSNPVNFRFAGWGGTRAIRSKSPITLPQMDTPTLTSCNVLP
jgi:hypothetical protein